MQKSRSNFFSGLFPRFNSKWSQRITPAFTFRISKRYVMIHDPRTPFYDIGIVHSFSYCNLWVRLNLWLCHVYSSLLIGFKSSTFLECIVVDWRHRHGLRVMGISACVMQFLLRKLSQDFGILLPPPRRYSTHIYTNPAYTNSICYPSFFLYH